MKVVITSPVNHDGKELEIGETVDMPKAQAEQLIAGGAALAAGGKKAAAEAEAPAAE